MKLKHEDLKGIANSVLGTGLNHGRKQAIVRGCVSDVLCTVVNNQINMVLWDRCVGDIRILVRTYCNTL